MRTPRNPNVLLVAMPCLEAEYPSMQIGCLAAYARNNGFRVDSAHLHLEFAIDYGLEEYRRVLTSRLHMGDLIAATFLYPDHKEAFKREIGRYHKDCDTILNRFIRSAKKVYRSVHWSKYDLVGFTISCDQLFVSLLFAKWLKRDYPHLRIVFGGPLVANQLGANLLKEVCDVDWCIDGEGEAALVELLNCLRRSHEQVGDCVPGLIYRQGNNVKINPRRQIVNLDELPDPDYDQYFKQLEAHYLLSGAQLVVSLPVESSRGCPNRCVYCTQKCYWSGYRTRRPQSLADQLERLVGRYGVKKFVFTDSTISKEHARLLFETIGRRRLDIDISCEVRADIGRRELELMRNSGVGNVIIGIESFSSNVLGKMNKGTRVIDNIKVMKYCEELNINYEAIIILGFPGETLQDIKESIRNMEYAAAYNPPVGYLVFKLNRGNDIYEQPGKYGVFNIRNPKPFDRILPASGVAGSFFINNSYSTRINSHDYSTIKERLRKWRCDYEKAFLNNMWLLSYYDLKNELRIEDCRASFAKNIKGRRIARCITIEEPCRGLYLFCGSVRSFEEIKARYPNWNKNQMKRALNKLVNLKVMFREDDEYLSLAIRVKGRAYEKGR